MKRAFLVALLVLLGVGACLWTMVDEPEQPPPPQGTEVPTDSP